MTWNDVKFLFPAVLIFSVASLGSVRNAHAQASATSGSFTLLDFESDAQVESLLPSERASVEPVADSTQPGRVARFTFEAVPAGIRAYPSIVLKGDGLRTSDFTRYEAVRLRIRNEGAEPAELSLSVWDREGKRSFPVPSTFTIEPGEWQQVVARLALHGIDATQIGSVHFYQKVNRRPHTLLIDDVQLLSPQAGRIAAKIQQARRNLGRAGSSAKALGAQEQIEPSIASLSERLDKLEEATRTVGSASERTRRLLELAQVASAADELTRATNVSMQGRRLTFYGPQPQADWMSNGDLIRGLEIVRLFDTSIGDEVFARLEPADKLINFIAGGPNLTGAGIEQLTSNRLRVLYLSGTSARDDALSHVAKFQALENIRLNDTNVTSGVLEHLKELDILKTLWLDDTGISDAGFANISEIATLENLTLRRTQVTGESLRHLSGLKNLKSLDLRDTQIDDAGLAHLSRLYRLESLQLAGTPIIGASFKELRALDAISLLNLNGTRVGDAAIRSLGAIPKLQRLELSSTRITDASLQHVTESARLGYLDVYGTNITDAGLSHLSKQTGLRQLYVAGTQVSDEGVAQLSRLTRLTELDLQGTQITDTALASLKGMKGLVTLRLANTNITGKGLAQLSGLSKLQTLDLSGTRLTDNALRSISNLESLRRLYVGGTDVTDAGMETLAEANKLIELRLSATAVGDEGLRQISKLPNLQRLELNETPISDQGLKHLAELKSLRVLSLKQTRITDEGIAFLGDNYQRLDLDRTRITDRGVEQLQKNDQLTELSLAATEITDNSLRLLQATPNLQRLNVAETNVTDAGLSHLSVLPELTDLDLSNTRISDVGVDPLLKMPSLQTVALENSRVTSRGVSWMRHNAPNLRVDMVFPWTWGQRWSYYTMADGSVASESNSLADEVAEIARLGLGYLHVEPALQTPEVLRSLKDLSSLEHLSFKDTQLKDQQLEHLLGLSQIARLDLEGTSVTDGGMFHLKDMNELRELSLRKTALSGSGLEHLESLRQLQSLNLSETPLQDESLALLAGFERLTKLELSETPITDRGIENLSELKGLQYLDLFGTRITDAGVARLKAFPELRACYLSNTAVTDTGIQQLGRFAAIRELGLDGTGLSDRGLEDVCSLRGLTRLRIGRSNVTEAGVAKVAQLPELVSLGLRDLPITDTGLGPLQSLSKLESLDLSGTLVTDAALTELGQLPSLTRLNLRDTQITPDGVLQFQSENPDVDVLHGIARTGYSWWSIAITVMYGIVVIAICFYGIHRYWLTWSFLRDKKVRQSPDPKDRFTTLPTVTVQLPMFNERQVAERIIEAACAFDYPREQLQIQVLDDSTDDSAEIAERCCQRMSAAGHNVVYLHRKSRGGFKGGALAAGLESATGKYVAVFDADFVPPPDILKQTIHHFTDDEVGMVQTEWEHLNRTDSTLTQCQAMFLDGHFVVEQTVRSRSGRWFNFNGTAGVWRKRCIEEAGGWQHDTLTEDTDLSYRAQLAGWKFVYLPTVHCPAELPATITAFLGQQHRWTKGLIQNAKKLLPKILFSDAPWRVKVEAWFHLTAPVMYLVMFILTVIALPALFFATPLTHMPTLSLALGMGALALGTVAAGVFYVVSQRAKGIGLLPTLFRLSLLMALGIGVCVVTARAVVEALIGFESPFVRTPKFGGRTDCDQDPAISKRRLQVPTGLVELVIGGALFACVALSLMRPYTLVGAPFLLMFACGYAAVGVSALLDRYSAARRRSRSSEPAVITIERGAVGWFSLRRIAVGSLAILALFSIAASMFSIAYSRAAWAGTRPFTPATLGVDLTAAPWRARNDGQQDQRSAIRQLRSERGAIVLNVELDEATDQGEILLDLTGPVRGLGASLGTGRELIFDIEYPSRFTGELQAFMKDAQNRSEYGSMEVVESHDTSQTKTVSLIASERLPAMGYQDVGFDPGSGIRQIGLKVSAQSDRVRGSGYRRFRGTIAITSVRVRDVDPKAHPEPETRTLGPADSLDAKELSPAEFVRNSGADRPWPLGYGFSGPFSESHREELTRTYEAMRNRGLTFTRVYIGDYRTGLLLDGKGAITGVEPDFISYLDGLAEAANKNGITVMLCLTDNTIADGRGLENAEYVMRGPRSDQFIDNVLVRFVDALRDRDVVWDIFNEPENVTRIPLREIQHYVDRVLTAGLRVDPEARFTVVSRSRPEVAYWRGRGLHLLSHNVFTQRGLKEALDDSSAIDAPIMVAEIAPELATKSNLESLRAVGYHGVGIWGWGTDDKYNWKSDSLDQVTEPLMKVDNQ